MRIARIVAIALTMSACASTPPAPASESFAARSDSCSRSGGVLVPAFGGYGAGGGYSCKAQGFADARMPAPRPTEVR